MRMICFSTLSRATKAAMASGRFWYWVEPPRCHAASKLAPPTSMPRKMLLSDEAEAVMILLPWFSRQGSAPGSSNVRPALTTVRVSGPFNQTRRGARSRRSHGPPSRYRNARPADLIREAAQTYDPVTSVQELRAESEAGGYWIRALAPLGRDDSYLTPSFLSASRLACRLGSSSSALRKSAIALSRSPSLT